MAITDALHTLHSNIRMIEIDTYMVKATDFTISEKTNNFLVKQGGHAVSDYINKIWLDRLYTENKLTKFIRKGFYSDEDPNQQLCDTSSVLCDPPSSHCDTTSSLYSQSTQPIWSKQKANQKTKRKKQFGWILLVGAVGTVGTVGTVGAALLSNWILRNGNGTHPHRAYPTRKECL